MNSETDFVSRGESFSSLTQTVANIALNKAKKSETPISTKNLEELKSIKADDKQIVSEHYHNHWQIR